MTAVNMAGY